MEVSLRPLVESDLGTVRNWRNHPDVARYMYSSGEITPEQQADWFARVRNDPTKRYWLILYGDRPVGVVNLAGIVPKWKKCALGIYFAPGDHRGKGLGRKTLFLLMEIVFGEMGLNKLVAEAFSWNTQAIALYERMGMIREGLLREEVLKDGEFHDIVRLAIKRADWEEMRGQLEAWAGIRGNQTESEKGT